MNSASFIHAEDKPAFGLTSHPAPLSRLLPVVSGGTLPMSPGVST